MFQFLIEGDKMLKLKKRSFWILFFFLFSIISAQNNEENKIPNFTVQIGGTYFYDGTEGANPASTFALGFARLVANGKITKMLSYQIMTDLAGLSDAASGLATRRSILKQAWVEYNLNKLANFRVGQFKYPFGLEAYGSVTKWKFIIPSYATIGISKRLGLEGSMFRDIGAQFSGTISGGKNVSIVYKAMVMNGNGPNILDNNSEKDFVANLAVKLPFNLSIAGSYFAGKTYDSDGAGVDENAFSANIAVQNSRFTLQAEYLSAKNNYATKEVTPSGYYAYGTYKLFNNLELGIRYDAYDKDTAEDNNSKSRVTLMTGYYFSKLNRIMLNYSLRNDEANPDWGNTFWALFQIVL